MSTWLFSLDDGAAPLVITSLVEIPSISRERRIHTELKANVNTCSFRCRFDASLWGYLISATSIQISITKDSAAYFTGYVSPNFETKIRDGQKYIEMRVEDYTLKKLGQTITEPLVCPGYAVCDPAAPAASLVHVIAARAGVTVSPAVPTISTVVPYVIVLTDDKANYSVVLGDILFEHKHVFNFTEPGLLDVVPYVNTGTITPTGTLSTAPGTRNLRGELVPKKVAEKYDDIRVSYSEVELKTGLILFQDTDGATGSLPCNIELAAAGNADGKDYYPKTADDGEVFAEWKSPDGYDIWIATSAAMDVTLGAGIVVQQALSNYYRKCSFGYRNTAAAVRNITKMRVTGNAYVRTSKNTARVSESGAADLFEHECKYVFSKAAAQALAAALAQYYRYSDLAYTAKSKDALALGSYVTVADPVYSGISTICRVVGIFDAEQQPGLYTYALEGAADYESVTIVTEGSATPPSSPNIGGQTPQEVVNAIELASKVLSISTSAIKRSRAGTLSPTTLTANARNADGTAYYGRLRISLSHDGQTYQAPVYSSASDESSYTYTVPATMDVSGISHYVVSGRAELYAAGGFETLLGSAIFSVSLDASAAAVYWGVKDTVGDWPTVGILPGDYLLDGRAPVTSGPAEGGVLRQWTGTAWIEYTPSMLGYDDAFARSQMELLVWAKEYGVTTIVALNAIIGSLTASEAFITTFNSINVRVKGTIKTGDGAADNARVAIIDETGTSQLAFVGTGVDDMAIVEDGAVDGAFTVKVTKGWSPSIGDIGPGGGKIFYIDLVNKFALEAAPADISDSSWSNITSQLAGTSYAIGQGLSNTNLIVGQAGHTSSAAKNCLDYSVNGKSDWYLPSNLELKEVWSKLGSTSTLRAANGFAGSELYINSTEYNAFMTSQWRFSDVLQANVVEKYTPGHVRPIRTIDLHEYFQWREDSGAWSSDIEIVAGAQTTLTGYDIKISFASQIGHVTGDEWTFIQGSMIGLSIRNVAGVEYVHAEDDQLGVGAPQTAVAAGNITLGPLDNSVDVTTDAAVTINLAPGCADHHEIDIVRSVSSAAAVTAAAPSGETVEGAATFVTHGAWASATLNLAKVTLKKFGTNWRFVGGEVAGGGATGVYRCLPDGSVHEELVGPSTAMSGPGSATIVVALPRQMYSIRTAHVDLEVSNTQIGVTHTMARATNQITAYVYTPTAQSATPLIVAEGRWRA